MRDEEAPTAYHNGQGYHEEESKPSGDKPVFQVTASPEHGGEITRVPGEQHSPAARLLSVVCKVPASLICSSHLSCRTFQNLMSSTHQSFNS